MKATTRLLVAILAVAAVATGVALAAASPTVSTGSATAITDTSAVLQAFVNPGGNQTDYLFAYGPTAALGVTTRNRSAGHGSKTIAVARTVRALTAGTTYYYRVAALNRSGTANGAIRSFKTTGKPPASVVTGPTVNVGKYQATPTGSVNPKGAKATTWTIQYGLTPAYATETLPLPLAAVSVPLPVSLPLLGLAPGKLFHYRIVATNGSGASSGGDQTFFTFPAFRRTPRMTAHTFPSRLTRKPYTFTTRGSVRGAFFVPASLRCSGVLGIRAYAASRQVAFVVAQLNPDCTFSTPLPFRRLIGGGLTALRVQVTFRGNGYLKRVQRTDHVTLG